MPRCPDTTQAPILIEQVDSRNGHGAWVAGLAEWLRTTLVEMTVDGWANHAESQINIVDCLVNVTGETMMFSSATTRETKSIYWNQYFLTQRSYIAYVHNNRI